MYFPKELWFHIRSYVFQLMYPPHIQQKYKDHLKSIVRLPYFLKIQHQKSVIYQYSYLKQQFSDCNDLWKNLKKFVATGDFTLGKELFKFEKKFAKLIGTKYAIGVGSGTDSRAETVAFSAGATSGEYNHLLTQAEMNHNHIWATTGGSGADLSQVYNVAKEIGKSINKFCFDAF